MLSEYLARADTAFASLLVPLAAWILISGVDDLFILICYLARRLLARRRPPLLPNPTPETLRAGPHRPIAIFVPLWHEDAVIASMLEHNLAAIDYPAFDFFVGVYPNDPATNRAVARVEARHPNVHLAQCPHDGPTSKADCLNWIYQRMLLYEQETGAHFDTILTHDAEDIIHPQALQIANYYGNSYDMVQTPVLALATPLTDLTHGLYCDDFAEFHTKDLPVRSLLGGFIPSSGVGTSYSRRALERLAEADQNQIFHPDCLTEDYENGLRLHKLGCTQLFLPPGDVQSGTDTFFATQTPTNPERTREKGCLSPLLTPPELPARQARQIQQSKHPTQSDTIQHPTQSNTIRHPQTNLDKRTPRHSDPIATREFFPRSFHAALRQRTRWVTGIALQGWQRHGWSGGRWGWYWLWRDRKGLLGNPLSILANLLFFYGTATWIYAVTTSTTWGLQSAARHLPHWCFAATAALGLLQLATRAWFAARFYGWIFALGAPVRAVAGNILNSAATLNALWRFAAAQAAGKPLVWLKTQHAYPSLLALQNHKRPLGEILVEAGFLRSTDLEQILAAKPSEDRLGVYLVQQGLLREEHLCTALAIQHGLDADPVDAARVDPAVARSIPASAVRDLQALPFALDHGALKLAVVEIPTDRILAQLRRFSRLPFRFTLVTPQHLQTLQRQFL